MYLEAALKPQSITTLGNARSLLLEAIFWPLANLLASKTTPDL